jgi:hypothetical protein
MRLFDARVGVGGAACWRTSAGSAEGASECSDGFGGATAADGRERARATSSLEDALDFQLAHAARRLELDRLTGGVAEQGLGDG